MRLSSTEDSVWEEREAAILALGAVAEGCITGLLPHLTQVCFGRLVVDIVHWPLGMEVVYNRSVDYSLLHFIYALVLSYLGKMFTLVCNF